MYGNFVSAWLSAGDYEEIQNVLDGMGSSISFSDIVRQLLSGNLSMTFESVGRYIYECIFSEINANRTALLQIIGIALIGAVFTNLSVAFARNYVARTGFYVTYILLFSLFLTAFSSAYSLALDILESLLNFCGALMPAFAAAVAFSSGTVTASGFYSMMVIAITVVDWLICKIVLRCIQIYLIFSLVNQISKEVNLSRLTELLRSVITWTLKTLLGVTLGLNVIQGMILPAFDSFKNTTVMKIASAIPGIGNALNAAAQTAIGSGVLLKNALGVGGLIVIIVLCALPLLKLAVLSLMYRLTEGLVAPVSDAGISDCIHATADSVFLLLMAVGTAMLLFVLSLAVIASASNFGIG